MYANEITIPAAFYEVCLDQEVQVPIDQEIRHKGKGKQYVINRLDPNLTNLINRADFVMSAKAPHAAAARQLLLALRKQGVQMNLRSEVSERTLKPVTRKVAAKATGRDYNRDLVVTITPRGDLILRPAGRRQAEQVALSDVYAWAQRNRCLRIAREKAAERKAKRKK